MFYRAPVLGKKCDRRAVDKRLNELKKDANIRGPLLRGSNINPDTLVAEYKPEFADPFDRGMVFMVTPFGWRYAKGFKDSPKNHPGLVVFDSPIENHYVKMAPGTSKSPKTLKGVFELEMDLLYDPGFESRVTRSSFFLSKVRTVMKDDTEILFRLGRLSKTDSHRLNETLSRKS